VQKDIQGKAGVESSGEPHDKAGESSEAKPTPPTPKPAEAVEMPKASPPPIIHKSSRSKKPVAARGNNQTSRAAARAAAIKSLLEKAEYNLKKYRLTTPEKDCAYYYYKKVLLMDPGNDAASQGILLIGDAYGRLADGEIGRFQYEEARVYVGKGLKVDPKNPHLRALDKKLSREKPLIFIEDVGNKVKNLFD
jgi:hypothetical protein